MTKTATATVTTTAPSDTRSVPDPPTYWAPAGSTVTLLTVLDGWSELRPAVECSTVLSSVAAGRAGFMLLEN